MSTRWGRVEREEGTVPPTCPARGCARGVLFRRPAAARHRGRYRGRRASWRTVCGLSRGASNFIGRAESSARAMKSPTPSYNSTPGRIPWPGCPLAPLAPLSPGLEVTTRIGWPSVSNDLLRVMDLVQPAVCRRVLQQVLHLAELAGVRVGHSPPGGPGPGACRAGSRSL